MSPPVPHLPNETNLSSYESLPPDFISPIRRFPANESAQEFVYDAWECDSPDVKFQLCLKALEKFPFSVDAFNCMADIYKRSWRDDQKALVAYERALDCARMLWPGMEQKEEILWGHIENRPFLRAVHGLSVVNLKLGETAKAVEQLRFLLKVNESDNQGCRMILFSALLELEEFQEAEELAEKHSNGRNSSEAWFLWGFVILDFVRFQRGLSDSHVPEEALAIALQANNFVPELLLRDQPPTALPETVAAGSVNEATSYAKSAFDSWRKCDGALAWLQEVQMRGGQKPSDDGTILFNLLTKGKVLVVVQDESGRDSTLEVTSSLDHMHGTMVPGFELPRGMKTHDPSKIVCFDLDWDTPKKFPSFSYAAVKKVFFWSVLESSKKWKGRNKDRFCGKCYKSTTLKCSCCHYVCYCSASCQKQDWKRHKKQCPKFIKK